MFNKTEAWRNMSNKKDELRSIEKELAQAKEVYREALVDDAVSNILLVINEEGKIKEKDLKLFLGNLAIQTMELYSK